MPGIRALSRRGHPHRRRRHHRENGRPEAGGRRGIGRGRGRGLAHRRAEPGIRDPLRPRGPQGDPDAAVEHVRLHQGRSGHLAHLAGERHARPRVSAFGSGTNENQFLIDGTNFTCPCNGVARAEPGVDFIQEVQVQSVGASAEFGNVQGAVINVITRQGSERFLYDASYYGQTAGLTSQPVAASVSRRRPAGRAGTSARGTATSRRTSAVRSFAIGCGSSPDTSTCATTTVSRAPIRASRGPTSRTRSSRSSRGGSAPAWQLVQSFHDEFWVNPDQPTLVTPFEATAAPARARCRP